jgi:MFS family permease
MPDYMCVKDGVATSCFNEDTCLPDYNKISSPQTLTNGYYIDWTSDTSFNNWYVKLDLRCMPAWYVGFFSSIYFFGQVLGTLFLSTLADTHGRIKMLKIY